MVTIQEALKLNSKLLKEHNIESFRLDSEILLCFVLAKTREFLLTYSDYRLSFFEQIRYQNCIRKRIKGYSVAVIIGKKSFYAYDFFVNKHVLVPRPETELMVEKALSIINSNKNNFNIIDIGTGSACIITTIALELKNKVNLYRAIDISSAALRVACKNIKKYNLDKDILLFQGNLLEPVIDRVALISPDNPLLITANLPYLREKQVQAAPSVHREPRLALIASESGLGLYRLLFKQIREFQKHYSQIIYLLCEIDPSQSTEIKKLQEQYLANWNFEIKNDLAGQNRLVIISN